MTAFYIEWKLFFQRQILKVKQSKANRKAPPVTEMK